MAKVLRIFYRRSLFWILFYFAILCAAVNAAVFMFLDLANQALAELAILEVETPRFGELMDEIKAFLDLVDHFYIPATAGAFLLIALLLWLSEMASLSRVIKKHGTDAPPEPRRPQKPVSEAAEAKARQRTEQRIFTHMVSVLQREGRLLDFLSEDLEAYEDEDIGAAVRSIHENCAKSMEKYLSMTPVLEDEEESEITIEAGFDPNAVKLTGNVTGDPPFKGIVRHRGWKAEKLALPDLSADRDPAILAPAEVDVI